MLIKQTKKIAVHMLHNRVIGQTASIVSHGLGARRLSRKLSQITGYVPPVVDIEIPRGGVRESGRFRMFGIGGLDQVARCLWWGGWHGYERPLPDFFLACARQSRFVLDVGAYTGFYSLLAARSS